MTCWNSRKAWRVWVSVETWDDPWFYSLPDDKQRLTWLYLITPSIGNKSGIFELNYRKMCDYLRVRKNRLDIILKGFENDGKVKLELSYCWVINFLEFQSYSGSARASVLSDLSNYVTRAPKLVQMWHERYPGYTVGVPADDRRGGLLNTNTNTKTITPATCDSDESHPLYELVSEMIGMIAKACGDGKRPNNQMSKCLKIVDQVIRLDKIPQADLVPMLRWALADPFWGGKNLINSIPQWRKNISGMPKIHNCWTSWKTGRNEEQKVIGSLNLEVVQ